VLYLASGAATAAPLSQLSAQTEILDERPVPGDVLAGEVLQEPATAADKQQQPAAAVVVVLVHFQMLGQICDPPSQQRDLDLRRAGVTLIGRVPGDDLLLHRVVERHVAPLISRDRGDEMVSPRYGQPPEGAANQARHSSQ